jgi:hypothetical protein
MTAWCGGVHTCTLNGHLYRVAYTRCRINTINSSDDGHMAARNMYKIEINIYKKEMFCHVSYLQGLYREAWSTEHKILIMNVGNEKCIDYFL